MNNDKFVSATKDVLSLARNGFANKVDQVGKGSNRGPYLPINQHNKNYPHTDHSPLESQDSMGAERSYLSNGSIGVDKTRIGVRIQSETIHIDTFLQNLFKPKKGGYPNDGIAEIPNFPEIYCKWDQRNFWLVIEFNPSDFTRVENLELCPFELLPLITELVLRKVLSHGDPFAIPTCAKQNKDGTSAFQLEKDWTDSIDVYRIDLARDFHIDDPRFSLSQLEEVWPIRSRNQSATHFLNSGQINTLSNPVSKRSTKIKLYDKYEERKQNKKKYLKPIPEGTFRFEASFPRHQLRETHLTKLKDLTPRRLEILLKQKWKDSNYWQNLVWEGQQLESAHDSQLSSARVNEVFGFIEATRLQINMRYSKRELEALRQDLRALGLTSSLPLSKQGKPYAHLHFLSGDLSAPIPDGFNHTKQDLFSIIRTKPIPKLS